MTLRNTNCHRAFTLIELLVVVSIIGVLAALIFPAIRSSQTKSKQMKCMSQLRQWGIAVSSYSQENNQMIRFYRWFSTAGNENFYSPYLSGNQDAFRVCPADPQQHTYLFVQARERNEKGGYSKGGVDTDGDGRLDSYSRAKMARPAQFLLMMDIAKSASSVIPYDPPVFKNNVKPMTEKDSADNRHGSLVNGLFADGHVESFKWDDIDPDKPANTEKVNTWFNLD